jgi:hypothetical protein
MNAIITAKKLMLKKETLRDLTAPNAIGVKGGQCGLHTFRDTNRECNTWLCPYTDLCTAKTKGKICKQQCR